MKRENSAAAYHTQHVNNKNIQQPTHFSPIIIGLSIHSRAAILPAMNLHGLFLVPASLICTMSQAADDAQIHQAVLASEYVVRAELVNWPAAPAPIMMRITQFIGYSSPSVESAYPRCNQYLLLTDLPAAPELLPIRPTNGPTSQQYIIAFSSLTRADAHSDFIQARAHGIFPLSSLASIQAAIEHAHQLNIVKSCNVLALVQHGTGRCISRKPLGETAYDLEYLIECTVQEAVCGCEVGQKLYYIFSCAEEMTAADDVGDMRDFSRLGQRFIGSNREEEISRNEDGSPTLRYNRIEHISTETIRQAIQ